MNFGKQDDDIDSDQDEENEEVKKMKKSYCPIDTFINVIKGKRKSTIILHLSLGNKRYNELVKLIPDISERMMSKQLKELEADNLINREVFPEVPPKVEYSLTDLGKEIHPYLKGMFKGGIIFENSIDSEEN
jgi:DNA-binding HxlR family transcriptional regulator